MTPMVLVKTNHSLAHLLLRCFTFPLSHHHILFTAEIQLSCRTPQVCVIITSNTSSQHLVPLLVFPSTVSSLFTTVTKYLRHFICCLRTCSASSWMCLNSSMSFSVMFSWPGSFSSSSRQSLPSWLSEDRNTVDINANLVRGEKHKVPRCLLIDFYNVAAATAVGHRCVYTLWGVLFNQTIFSL